MQRPGVCGGLNFLTSGGYPGPGDPVLGRECPVIFRQACELVLRAFHDNLNRTGPMKRGRTT